MSTNVPPDDGVSSALAAVADAAAGLPGADISGVLLADEHGDSAAMHACAGRWSVHSVNLRVRRGHGLAGHILATRKPWKVDDYACDRSISADEFGAMLADDGTQAGLGAPMLDGEEIVGVLMVWSRRRGAFDAAATQALVRLADLAALAVAARRGERAARREAADLAAACSALTARVADHERGAALRDELAALLLAGAAPDALLTAACAHTGGDAVLLDPGLGELASCGTSAPIRDRIASRTRRVDGAVLPPGPGFPRWTLLRTVAADGVTLAQLGLGLPHRPLAADHATAGHLATACALHLAQERAVGEARSRAHADFVWQLLEGLVDEPVARARARQLGCPLPRRLRVLVVPVEGTESARLDVLVAVAERTARAMGVEVLAGRRGGTLAVVLGTRDDDETGAATGAPMGAATGAVFGAATGTTAGSETGTTGGAVGNAAVGLATGAAAGTATGAAAGTATESAAGTATGAGAPSSARTVVEQVLRALRRHAGSALGVAGVSACVDFSADLRDAHSQARHARAVAAAEPAAVAGGAVLFDELGLLRFLLAPNDRADQLRYARSVLGAVLDYDRDHHTDLVTTLGAWLDEGGSLTRAAERLFVHPKTVRYRLRRVEQLTGRDLAGSHDRFDAQLAITVLRALAVDAPAQEASTFS